MIELCEDCSAKRRRRGVTRNFRADSGAKREERFVFRRASGATVQMLSNRSAAGAIGFVIGVRGHQRRCIIAVHAAVLEDEAVTAQATASVVATREIGRASCRERV